MTRWTVTDMQGNLLDYGYDYCEVLPSGALCFASEDGETEYRAPATWLAVVKEVESR